MAGAGSLETQKNKQVHCKHQCYYEENKVENIAMNGRRDYFKRREGFSEKVPFKLRMK